MTEEELKLYRLIKKALKEVLIEKEELDNLRYLANMGHDSSKINYIKKEGDYLKEFMNEEEKLI